MNRYRKIAVFFICRINNSMPVPSTNNGSTYYNINQCRSFNQIAGTSLTKLSSQPCSEIELYNRTGGLLSAYDNGFSQEPFAMLLNNNESIVLRGLTNSDQVSAKAAGAGPIFYRTQFFSSNPLRS
jgi:hypothetical protein